MKAHSTLRILEHSGDGGSRLVSLLLWLMIMKPDRQPPQVLQINLAWLLNDECDLFFQGSVLFNQWSSDTQSSEALQKRWLKVGRGLTIYNPDQGLPVIHVPDGDPYGTTMVFLIELYSNLDPNLYSNLDHNNFHSSANRIGFVKNCLWLL